MLATEVFATLVRAGLKLQPLPGGKLYVEPRHRITPQARELIVAHREALLDFVRARSISDQDPADRISDYLERLAISCELGGVSEDEAHAIACAEVGASLDDLVRQQVACWHSRCTQLSESAHPRLAALLPASLEMLHQSWMPKAVRCGWTDCEIFGLDRDAPRASRGNGLITGVVLTALTGPLRIVDINAEFVLIETGTGSMLRQHRHSHCSPPIWLHPAFSPTLH